MCLKATWHKHPYSILFCSMLPLPFFISISLFQDFVFNMTLFCCSCNDQTINGLNFNLVYAGISINICSRSHLVEKSLVVFLVVNWRLHCQIGNKSCYNTLTWYRNIIRYFLIFLTLWLFCLLVDAYGQSCWWLCNLLANIKVLYSSTFLWMLLST